MSIALDINLPLGYTATMMTNKKAYTLTDEETAAGKMMVSAMIKIASKKSRMADADYEYTVENLKSALRLMQSGIIERGV